MIASANQAEAWRNATLRFLSEFDDSGIGIFHSYSQYRFTVDRRGEIWSIPPIEQILIMSKGNPALTAPFENRSQHQQTRSKRSALTVHILLDVLAFARVS
jgi:hypothetical protein